MTYPYFLNPLKVEYIDGRRWRLTSPLTYTRSHLDQIKVPSGFCTDFASVPRFFWRLLPPAGAGPGAAYGMAAVIHDFLYATGLRPRAECDKIFREAMATEGVTGWRRWAMYLAVRSFGWLPWRRYRKGMPYASDD